MTLPPTQVHRTTLSRTRPSPLPAKDLVAVVDARYQYAFGAAQRPDLLIADSSMGWSGTYSTILRQALDDILNRDPSAAPWPTSLVVDLSKDEVETVAGHAVRFNVEADEIEFADGSVVKVEDVHAIGF